MENQVQEPPQPQIVQQPPKVSVLQKFPISNAAPRQLVILGIVVVFIGIISGYALSRLGGGVGGGVEVAPGAKIKGNEIGIEDTKTFRDSATGVLREGGIDGEGTHHLEREGGASQNVYLTSSVVDLGEFVGKKVEVWGETFKGQKAGWFMDVGRLKIVE